jgi:hypothetical protein
LKKKTEKHFAKQLNSCERNIQELRDSMKIPNLRIMVSEEGEAVQAKEIHNTFK